MDIGILIYMSKKPKNCAKMVYKNSPTKSAMAFCETVDIYLTPCLDGFDDDFLKVFCADQISLEIVHILTDYGFQINYCRVVTKRQTHYDHAAFDNNKIYESIKIIRPTDVIMAGNIVRIRETID